MKQLNRTTNRGGKAFGRLDKTDMEFLRPDFDKERQVAERAVGMYATSADPQVVDDDNAQLEGNDI
jgi:hypothetical protein